MNLEDYQDDPAAGVFWGPPLESGVPRRWSRAWFEWRDDYDAVKEAERASRPHPFGLV